MSIAMVWSFLWSLGGAATVPTREGVALFYQALHCSILLELFRVYKKEYEFQPCKHLLSVP